MKSSRIRFVMGGWFAAIAALALVSCGGGGGDSGSLANEANTSTATLAATQELGNAFAATLLGAEETPPVVSFAQGSGTVVVNANTREMIATVTTIGIIGTAAHIHQAARGIAGPIVFPLSEASPGSGIWSGRATLTDDQFNILRAGNFYFNVHSAAFPNGEIRGQIVAQQAGSGTGASNVGTGTNTAFNAITPSLTNFLASLKGAQEVPPTPSTAQASAVVMLNPTTREILAAVTTTGIVGTAAHIHQGALGVNGPIIIPLSEVSVGSGVWVARTVTTETQHIALLTGNLYFNVHSTAFPNGEIRGQILQQQQVIATLIGIPTTGTPALGASGTSIGTTGTTSPGSMTINGASSNSGASSAGLNTGF